MRTIRNYILLFTLIALLSAEAGSQQQPLLPERTGDHIHVAAPQLHFLAGHALEKLQNGSTVTYFMRLAVLLKNSRKPVAHIQEKFLVSYDLWEETYSAVQSKPGGRSASRMTASRAEMWCLENTSISIHSIPERQAFMLRFECFAGKDDGKNNQENHSSLTLAGLIDIFGRKKPEEPFHWEAVAGPFRLEELK